MANNRNRKGVEESMSTLAPPPTAECEADLLKLALGGDRHAFGELTSIHQSRSLALAAGIVGNRDDALDVFQDSVLKAWQALDRFVPGKPFFPWFYRILRNGCIQQLRRRKVRFATSLSTINQDGNPLPDPIDQDAPQAHEILARDESSQLLACTLVRLTPKDREILMLKHFDGLTYRELADALSIPVGTVMSRLSTARKRLRNLLPENQF
jgi:RNA polymerase sigma-70 factor (ECF subfamily)